MLLKAQLIFVSIVTIKKNYQLKIYLKLYKT